MGTVRLVDKNEIEYSASNPLPVDANLVVSDIQIGAVELKDSLTSNRAKIDGAGNLNILNSSQLIPFEFDSMDLTYISSGNGIGEVGTVTYKSFGNIVAVLTLSYDVNNNLVSVVRT